MLSLIALPYRMFKRFRQSIAYMPSQLAFVYLILGLLAVVPSVQENTLPSILGWLDFKDPDTARALLSTLIAAMISMVVFSFSMVMTVLSQAGGNFSHKLVFGLITERHHQRVLGHYLGTILFILILLMVPFKGETPTLWRSMGVYLGVMMVIHCLALFVYFIHNASQSVQINAITMGLHLSTRESLERLEALQRDAHWQHRGTSAPGAQRYHTVNALQSGYIQNVDLETLAKLAADHDAVIHLNFSFGDYTVENFPLFKVEANEPPDEQFVASLLAELIYVQGESVKDLYTNGLTQLMEIAIKALSPGINDPGTARLCLHTLTELLCRRLKFTPSDTLVDDRGRRRVTWQAETFESLLYRLFTPIQHYGRDDVSICLALLKALKTLSLFACGGNLDAIQTHARRVVDALAEAAKDSLDRQFIAQRLAAGEHQLNLPSALPLSTAIASVSADHESTSR